MDTKEAEITKPPRKSPVLNHQYRQFHSKSKDKLLNDKSSCICHPRNKFSRVPKVSRIPLNISTLGIEGRLDDSGDNKAGTSNLSTAKELAFEKLKPSHIPRRKSSFGADRDKSGVPKNVQNFLGDSRNVQRVQLVINQDIRPEETEKAVSLASARPIPTLGQIYARNNIIHSERLNDWFVELDAPANSLESNMFAQDLSSGTSNICEIKNLNTNLSNDVVVYENITARRLCRPDKNMSEWLKTEIEYPTKDNESGYRSMSPNTHKPTDMKSKRSMPPSVTDIVKNVPEIKEIEKDEPTNDAQKSIIKIRNSCETMDDKVNNDSADGQTTEKPTTILAKIDVSAITDFTVDVVTKKISLQNNEKHEDINKNCQCPSNAACKPTTEDKSQIPVPSYVDYPSEVLQKTTNFEGDGCDTPPTISSVGGGLDLEIRDNFSSHLTMEHDDHITEWCSQCKSCDISDKVESETTSMADYLLCNLLDDEANNYHKHYDHHHTYWKELQGHDFGHCQKCHRYRKFPSSRYQLPTTLLSIKRRLSIHHCRLRLSKVWKRTAERWSLWSKSPQRLRRACMMSYLHRTRIWEDANVQTNGFVYAEAGTDSVMKEQRSACISALFYGPTCFTCSTKKSGEKVSPETSSSKNSKYYKHLNMGPSMFPFVCNSRILKRVISKRKIQDNICFNCSQKVTSETIDVQTKDSMQFKDTNDRGVDDHSLIESVSIVEISEIAVQEKSTNTEDNIFAPQMQSKVTSTFIHLDGIKVVNVQPKHAHTQICVPCTNAETDVRLPNVHSKGVSLLTDVDSNLDAIHSSRTYTIDKPVNRSVNVMTCIEPKKTLNHIRVSTSNKVENVNINNPHQVCRCSQIEVMSRGTEPYSNKTTSSKQTKMDTYFNTDVNSIGNKKMANISTCTHLQLKDSAVETDKEIFPRNSITVCACGCPETDLNSQQQSKFKPSSIVIKRSANVNTAEPVKDMQSSGEISNFIFSQNNSKRFDKVNTYYVEKKKKSVTQTVPIQLSNNHQRIDNISSYIAEKEIINITPSEDIDDLGKLSTDTNSILNVTTETRSIGQNKDIVKKSINISAINVQKATKSIEQSRANMSVVCKKSIDVNTHVQQETKSVVQSKNGLETMNTFNNRLTNNSTQYSNIDVTTRDSMMLRLDKMGQSRLLSIRTLGVNANEIYVQTDPVRFDDGPACRPNTHINQSVFTSQYTLNNSSVPTNTATCGHDVMPSRKNDDNTSNKIQKSIREEYSSNVESSLRFNTSAIVSSDLDADKWIKSCIEKGYQSHLETERASVNDRQEQDRREQAGAVAKHLLEEKVENNYNESLLSPTSEQMQSVKNIDTNDLVPTTNFSQQQIVAMVDNKTQDSGETSKKEFKETTLQVTPEMSEAATDCIKPLIVQKSECVFTSRCILPPVCHCGCHNLKKSGCASRECLFVYGIPTCIVHKQKEQDAAVQISPSKSFYKHNMTQKVSCQMPSVYEALYETSKLMDHESKISRPSVYFSKVNHQSPEPSEISTSNTERSKISSPSEQIDTNPPTIISDNMDNNITFSCSGKKVDKEVEVLILTRPEVRSATVVTSRNNHPVSVQCSVIHNMSVSADSHEEEMCNYSKDVLYLPQMNNECRKPSSKYAYTARLLDMPTHDGEDDCKTQLVTSCRYYSKLLTKQLDKVKDNLTRHLASNGNTYANYTYQIPTASMYTHQRLCNEACTMKPSAREEFGCQTFKNSVIKSVKSTGILSQAISLTDICRYDKHNLNSIYFMLSAIEGRIRRIKNNIEY